MVDTNNFSKPPAVLSSTLLKFDKSKISCKVRNLVCLCVQEEASTLCMLVFAFPSIIEIWLQLVAATNAKKNMKLWVDLVFKNFNFSLVLKKKGLEKKQILNVHTSSM